MKKKRNGIEAAIGIALILCVASGSFTAAAQGKPQLSADCIKYLSYYQEDYKAKKWGDATTNWRKAYAACPGNTSQNLYVHGTTLMTRRYDALKDPAARQAVVDTILNLQDRRAEFYPAKRVDILNNKGLYMVKYRGSDDSYIHDNLGPLIGSLEGKAVNSLLVSYFKATVSLFRKGTLSGEDVLTAYDIVSESMGASHPETAEEVEDRKAASTVIGTLYADCGLADCTSLQEIFTPRLAADPDNAALAGTIIRLMNATEDCAGTELYFKAVTLLHQKEPSHRSAYALYRMNAARGDAATAAAYLQEAIDAEDSDAKADAGYLYELAVFRYKNRQRTEAAETARRVIDMDCGYAGKGWLLMGNLWSSAPTSDELTGYARYWAAADCYRKAREIDPSLEDDVKAGLATCSRHYPEKSEIFMFDLEAGQAYTVRCAGLTATTTVRTK